jgi:hypothetical protein
MFKKLFSVHFSFFPLQNKKIITQNYHSPKKIDTEIKFRFPFCIDCRFYLPMEHSPMYPNSACKHFPQLKLCTVARSDSKLCGKEGVHYVPRIQPCKCKKT